MNKYTEDQIKLVDDYGTGVISELIEEFEKLSTTLKTSDIIKIFNTVVLPKNNLAYKISKVAKPKNKDKDKEEKKEEKICKRDDCDNPVATAKSKYCTEHKAKPRSKIARTCATDDCNEPVIPRGKYCLAHKLVKSVKIVKLCAKENCDNPIATAKSKYCIEHKGAKSLIPKFNVDNDSD